MDTLATLTIDEDAVEALDAAASTRPFDSEVLRVPAAADMRRQVALVVKFLEQMDHRKLLKKQNAVARLVGADVEARLEFELAGERVVEAVAGLRTAARNAKRVRSLLNASAAELATEQERLEAVIGDAQWLLGHANDGDEFHRARYERRLSNIMALHAANIMTIQQIDLADQVVASLIDRFTDVETLLLPLWQRHMLALATAGAQSKQAATEFAETNKSLIDYLKQDLSTS